MGSLPQISILRGPTKSFKPNLLHKIFEIVATGKDSVNRALIFEENGKEITYTYGELNELTNRMSRVIRKTVLNKNLERNSDGDYIIAVSMSPSDKLVITLLSIWKAGAAYLPIDPTFPQARVEHIIKEAKPVMVINEDCKIFPEVHTISFEDLLEESKYVSSSCLEDNECLHHAKDDLAIVLYTSGSTGVPKGVRLPHKVILNRLQWQFRTFPYGKTEKIGVFKTALTFVDSVSEIWGPLLNGLAVLIVPKTITTDPEKLVNILEKYNIQRLVLVPSLLRTILMYLNLKNKKSALENLKIWICSGETLAVSLAKEFFEYFPENEHVLCNFYGSTEIMGDVTYHVISGLDQIKNQVKIPIGQPVDNTIIYLMDKNYKPVKAGEIGELFVSGLNLAAGYVNGRDPDRFVDNPLAVDPTFAKLYRTGDFAKIEKGTLIYEGRTDSQVKIRGHRVDLSEVEKAVNSIEGIDKGNVLCYKPGEIDQALLAFVTTNTLMNEIQIENILRKQLTSYMVPQVIIMEKIPLLVNGKTDRQALLKAYENTNNNDDSCCQIDIDYSGIKENKLDAAKVLFETVASVLNRSARSTISINANFYDIGGNSLNSIYTITSLSEQGYHISISDFIAAMDLGEILEKMSRDKKDKATSHLQTYTSELLKEEHKDDVYDMIITSFYNKAELERCLMPDVSEADYIELLDLLWQPLIDAKLSFVLKTENDKIVGTSLCFDVFDEPEVPITSKLLIVFEYLETLEGPIRETVLPQGKGKTLHSFMMGTKSYLTPKENVIVMQAMEEEVLKLARERGFEGIFTTNTSPLTQQLATDVYGYQCLNDAQVNLYVAPDNTKPFGIAPDSQRAKVQLKKI